MNSKHSLIVEMCYDDVKMKDDSPGCTNFSVKCRFCPAKRVSGNVNSTTNFLKHIKVSYCLTFDVKPWSIICKYCRWIECQCSGFPSKSK